MLRGWLAAAVLARYGNGDDGLMVAIAHLSLGAVSRRAQLDFITELLAGHPHVVLMGDFNCVAERPEMERLYARTHLCPPRQTVPTFPSWRPQRAIDHILVSDALQPAALRAFPAANSDHLALALEIEVPVQAFEL